MTTADVGRPENPVQPYADALVVAIDLALRPWLERLVSQALERWGVEETEESRVASREVAEHAYRDVMPRIRELLGSDIDSQSTTPMAILREAVSYPTELLQSWGVAEPERDEYAIRHFPDDVFDLTPAALSDIDHSLAEPGLAWGAAKAFLHKRRHQHSDVPTSGSSGQGSARL